MVTTSRLKPQRQWGTGWCPRQSSSTRPVFGAYCPRRVQQRTAATSTESSTGGANASPTVSTSSSGGVSAASQATGSSPAPKKPPLGLHSLQLQGSADLAAIGMVYFVQGIMELATLAQTYHLKDNLHTDPAQVSLFLSLASIPWALKPLIGFVSDTVPLWGFHRRSYLLLASLAGCASYMWMGHGGFAGHGAWGFVGAMLMASAASAVSDVVADSMVVTRAREESEDSAGSLQSLCWACYAVGQILTASMSGSLVQDYGPATVFQLTAMFPLLVGLSSLLVSEQRSNAAVSTSTATGQPPHTPQHSPRSSPRSSPRTSMAGVDKLEPMDLQRYEPTPAYAYAIVPLSPTLSRSAMHAPTVLACNVESSAVAAAAAASIPALSSGSDTSNISGMAGLLENRSHPLFVGSNPPSPRVSTAAEVLPTTNMQPQQQQQKDGMAHAPQLPSRAPDESDNDKYGYTSSSGFSAASMRQQMDQLWEALKQPDMLAPLSFLLLLSATPTADTAMFYYQTEHLHFTPSFLGQVQLAAACASFAGVLLYNSVLKRMRLRNLLMWGTLLGAALQCGQLVLVSGVHRAWGVDDHTLVLGGSVVMDIIQNVLCMPTMVLAARLCPPGLEATMFATLMSMCNLADGVRLAGGAALMSTLGVTTDNFTNLPLLLLACNAALLLPLPLLRHIPNKFDRPEAAEEAMTTATNSTDGGSTSAVAGTSNSSTANTAAGAAGSAGPDVLEHVSDWFSSLRSRLHPQSVGQLAPSMTAFGSNNSSRSTASSSWMMMLPRKAGSEGNSSSQRRKRAAKAAAARRKPALPHHLLANFSQHVRSAAARAAEGVAASKDTAAAQAADVGSTVSIVSVNMTSSSTSSTDSLSVAPGMVSMTAASKGRGQVQQHRRRMRRRLVRQELLLHHQQQLQAPAGAAAELGDWESVDAACTALAKVSAQ